MQFNHITIGGEIVAELTAENICLRSAADALELMMAAGARALLLYERQIVPEFFRLPTGLLGDVLQKFTNYRMRLAIVGDFSKYLTKNFSDFMGESNRHGQFLFVATKEDAISRWSKTEE
jgi:hypothetical protein